MKAKNFNDISGKILNLTKQIYLKEPEDGSGLIEKFMTGKRLGHPFLGSSFGMEWWITRRTFECCDDIADMSISFDPQLEESDRTSLSKIIRETLRENASNTNLFTFESLFLNNANTLFEARVVENPKEFASHLWSKIYSNLANSLVKWLTMYPLHLVRTDSYILGFDGLTLLRSNDQKQWKKISEKYSDSEYWIPSTGAWANRIDNTTRKDFLLSPTWLVCEALGTASSTRSLSGDNMRTFIAILFCSCLDDQIPNFLTKSGADAASYSIQSRRG